MQQLRELRLNVTPFKEADLVHIPTSSMLLQLHDARDVSRSTMPQLQQMMQLQCLHLLRLKPFDLAMIIL